jgi:hypothetical protein
VLEHADKQSPARFLCTWLRWERFIAYKKFSFISSLNEAENVWKH